MSYKKMTVGDFRAKLEDGQYKNATGARRGAGKADMSDKDKAECYKAIDAHFGDDAPKTEKKITQAKKPKAQAKKVQAKKANGKPAAEKTEVKKGPGRGRRRVEQEPIAAVDGDSQSLVQLRLLKEQIGTIDQAIDTMRKAKEAYPNLDTEAGSAAAVHALTGILQGVRRTVQGDEQPNPEVTELLQRTAAAAQGLPGQVSPVVQLPNNSVNETSQLS